MSLADSVHTAAAFASTLVEAVTILKKCQKVIELSEKWDLKNNGTT
jgi:hypothetical protein